MKSEHTDQLTAALVQAQIVMPNATMNKTNPQFSSRYADLNALREASLKVLNDNGLAIAHGGDIRDGRFVMVATLLHTSGQWIESLWPMPTEAKPQAYGSANTYARRYTWGGLVGISSEEDDDGNAAEEAASEAPRKRGPAKAVNDNDNDDPYAPAAAAVKTAPVPPPVVAAPVNPATGTVEPHEIAFQQTKKGIGADSIAWSQSFLAAIATSATDLEISAWERANTRTLIQIEEDAPIVVKRLRAAIGKNYDRVIAAKKEKAA